MIDNLCSNRGTDCNDEMIRKIVKKRSQGKTILSWKTLKVWVFVMHAKYPSVVTIYDAYRGKYGESILRTLTRPQHRRW